MCPPFHGMLCNGNELVLTLQTIDEVAVLEVVRQLVDVDL